MSTRSCSRSSRRTRRRSLRGRGGRQTRPSGSGTGGWRWRLSSIASMLRCSSVPPSAVNAELAVDGIDEVLTVMLSGDEGAATQVPGTGTVEVLAGDSAWSMRLEELAHDGHAWAAHITARDAHGRSFRAIPVPVGTCAPATRSNVAATRRASRCCGPGSPRQRSSRMERAAFAERIRLQLMSRYRGANVEVDSARFALHVTGSGLDLMLPLAPSGARMRAPARPDAGVDR